jgi:hypothetical protein
LGIEDFRHCESDGKEAMIASNAFSISTVLLMASLAVDGSLSGASAAEASEKSGQQVTFTTIQ